MSFHLGQKIVCIDDRWHHPNGLPPILPRKGVVYTFAGWESYVEPGNPNRYLYVEEIPKCQPDSSLRLVSFQASHFRPVVERKTDISIFKRLLQPREKVPA